MQTIVCMKWGTRYPADYVNRLWSMVKRNTQRPTRLVCFTDDTSGISEEVAVHPLPPITLPERVMWLPWRKLSMWQAPLADLDGDVLYLDLDVVVTGGLDVFFDYRPGQFCAAENWTQPGSRIGNTSIYRWHVGRHSEIFDRFNADPEAVLRDYRIEQQYISALVDDMEFWPSDWCVSFKHTLLPKWPMNFFKVPPLPEGTRVVAFTGKPDPDEAEIGAWPVNAPWKRLYKHVRPTPWITKHWR
ncbi:hypothetical protein NOF55_05445 [Rhizobiaceae bacterium BDR2-2]|uniref:Glycosyltransferase n=1 Tax=Ectorhizobium quercum TaxID=2965071 RepID=A0AAE3MWG3_9HYPH|nr:hypothetical protein [Ectorhizobium quercum]MCX8996543.1 hypothetical protein [Ectorhizobium quercum]